MKLSIMDIRHEKIILIKDSALASASSWGTPKTREEEYRNDFRAADTFLIQCWPIKMQI